MKFAILGAGVTGIELGRRLKDMGKDFIILEKEPQAGGLCRTNKTGQYHWDFSVHALYSRHKEMAGYFHSLPLAYSVLDRKVRILHSDRNGGKRLLRYPFELGIRELPLEDKLECLRGYFFGRSRCGSQCLSLQDWIDRYLGPGIARHFMTPYNQKIWDCPLSRISSRLVTSKIEPSSTLDFILFLLGLKNSGRKHQARFIYPREGIQGFIEHLTQGIRDRIMLDSEVKRLEKKGVRWLVMAKDKSYEADVIFSTIPLVELFGKLPLDGLKGKERLFSWNDTFFTLVGLKRGCGFKMFADCHWAFFKEDEIFYRFTMMHNFSPEFAPALVAEVTRKKDSPGRSEKEISELVVQELIRLGIVASCDDIALTETRLVKYTYPIPTVGLEQARGEVCGILNGHNIFTVGRSGNWDYLNMDECILNVGKFISGNPALHG